FAVPALDLAQPCDLLFAGVHAPRHQRLAITVRRPSLQTRKRPFGGRKEIFAPFQAYERTGFVVEPVRTVELHTNGLAFMLETEMSNPARLGETQEGIAFPRIGAGAVAAGQPALHHLELFAEAGVVGHEDE